jgi:hypothetical protein
MIYSAYLKRYFTIILRVDWGDSRLSRDLNIAIQSSERKMCHRLKVSNQYIPLRPIGSMLEYGLTFIPHGLIIILPINILED